MERKTVILAAAAIPLGLGLGLAWSALTAPAPRAATPPKGTFTDIPPSPEEFPADADAEWTARANDVAGNASAARTNKLSADSNSAGVE